MGQIIQFPNAESIDQKKVQDIHDAVIQEKLDVAEHTADHVYEVLIHSLYNIGMLPGNTSVIENEAMLMYESVRAIACKVLRISHPLQDIAEDMFEGEVTEEDQQPTVKLDNDEKQELNP